jgi:hypothetical protein
MLPGNIAPHIRLCPAKFEVGGKNAHIVIRSGFISAFAHIRAHADSLPD